MIHLSNQAQWYLSGPFPIYKYPSFGNSAPEPKAMEELERNGLVYLTDSFYFKEAWNLSDEGVKYKTNVLGRK